MIPGLQTFIKNPNDVDGLTKSLESQKRSRSSPPETGRRR